jgi:hypothetical protein
MACTGVRMLDPRCQISSVADDAFSKIANSFAAAAAGAVNWLWTQLNTATSVDLASAGVRRDMLATGAIAVILCLALFLVQVITATVRREPGGLSRAVSGLGVAMLGSGFAIAATRLVLAAVDQLCDGVVQYGTGTNIDGLGTRFAIAQSFAQMTNPAALFLFALIILAAVVVVWGALMMRKLLIIVAAVMAPLAFAGGTADVTRGWVRRWIEFTAALIAAKLLLVVMLMVGLSVFQGAGLSSTGAGHQASTTQAGTQLATGSVLLLMAGFAPWIAIKMFHFAGDSLHAVHQQAAAARAGTQSVIAAPRKVNASVMSGRSIANAATGGAPSASSSGAGGGPRTPQRPGNPLSPGGSSGAGSSGGGGLSAGAGSSAGQGAAAASASAPLAGSAIAGAAVAPVLAAHAVGRSAATTADRAAPEPSATPPPRPRGATNA